MEKAVSLGEFLDEVFTEEEVPDEIFSDEEIPLKKHTALLKKAAATYGKKYQRVLVSDRNEPTLEGSEFHLSNKIEKDEKLAKTLAGSLEKEGKHSYIAQKLKKVQRSSKPLPTPLERPDAEKIMRAVAYDNTKTSLSRWEPMVVTNKITSELNFPLNTPFFKMRSTRDFMANYKPESKLEKEVENILSGLNEEIGEKPPPTPEPQKRTFYLNRKEILEQRKELARVRAQQSYREAKARRQNKIKSKKFHRILRREKTKKQLQEFEKLQKTDPEAALKKLDELEKTRAEERVSLRHRSTGQWAKNKAVHAKYDKESRQQLHQQLRMSRDLTMKVNAEQSSDDDDTEEDNPVSEDNPWIKGTNEYEEFTNKYRKYWNEQALNKCKSKENDSESNEELNDSVAEGRDYSQKTHLVLADPVEVDITNSGFIVLDLDEERMKNKKNEISLNRSWKCTSIRPKKPKLDLCKNEEEIDSMFEVMEKAIIEENRRKVSKLKDQSRENPKIKNRMPPCRRDIKAPEQCQVKADTSLEAINDESISDAKSKWNVTEVSSLDLKETGKLKKVAAGSSKAKFDECEINPSNFIQINEKQIKSNQIPDLIVEDDDNTTKTEKEMTMTISEAFTDDDVVAEFRQEKESIADKGKPKDIDLTLPGWGEWAGKGISASKRKKNRFVIKAPKNIPRKDDKKQSVIINENADSKARVHQVTELPHPYVAVESFESSIRAPLGSTWVPETAHRKLIAPKIKTLMGTVIEPLSEDALLDDSEEFDENDLD